MTFHGFSCLRNTFNYWERELITGQVHTTWRCKYKEINRILIEVQGFT